MTEGYDAIICSLNAKSGSMYKSLREGSLSHRFITRDSLMAKIIEPPEPGSEHRYASCDI